MFIERLTINNFRNLESKEFEFSKFNCIVGNNGVGKTNILDSIYYLSFLKSSLGASDEDSIRYGSEFFSLKGQYLNSYLNQRATYLLSYQRNKRKQISYGKQNYKKFSDHIGKLPCVIVSPLDQIYITGQSEQRRKFLDQILCQSQAEYMDKLIYYNKLLASRNKMLKNHLLYNQIDTLQLNIISENLALIGDWIQNKRRAFIQDFVSKFNFYYNYISDNKEQVDLKYLTYEKPLKDMLTDSLQKDMILGYTTKGIHRDDLCFLLSEHNVNHIASQGQQKTFVLALKFSQLSYLKKQKNITPILLLDDVFDKFDFKRVEKILSLINENTFFQVFLTDTHPNRVEQIINSTNLSSSQIIHL